MMDRVRIFWGIIKLGRPRKTFLFVSLGLGGMAAFFELCGFGLLFPLLQTILPGGEAQGALQDEALIRSVMLWVVLIGVSVALKLVCQFGSIYLNVVDGYRVLKNLRVHLFEYLLGLGCLFYDREEVGRVNTHLMGLSNIVSHGLQLIRALITNIFVSVSYVTVLFFLSWQLSVLTLVFLCASAVIIRLARVWIISPATRAVKNDLERGALAFDILSNMKLVKASGAEKRELRRFRHLEESLAEALTKRDVLMHRVPPLEQAVAILCAVIFLILTVHFMDMRDPRAVSLIVMALVAWRRASNVLIQLFSRMVHFAGQFPTMMAIHDLLDASNKPIIRGGTVRFEGIREVLEFRDLRMAYEKREVLKGVSFTVRKGEVFAITGPSGAGKTTLAELLLRFYEFQGGDILVDGKSIRRFDLASLRARMGMVGQETMVLHGSFAENIAYAKPAATREEIIDAARLARLHERIAASAEGYDTPIGDRGSTLSAGELQRLQIARMFLKNPEILILDEATRSIDSSTQEALKHDLRGLMRGRTTFLIACDLSFPVEPDRVLRLERGRVISSFPLSTSVS